MVVVEVEAIDDLEINKPRECRNCKYFHYGIDVDGYNCLLTNQRTYDYEDVHHEYLDLCPFETLLLRLNFNFDPRSECISFIYDKIIEFINENKDIKDIRGKMYLFEPNYTDIDEEDSISIISAKKVKDKTIDVVIDKYYLENILRLKSYVVGLCIKMQNPVNSKKDKTYLPCKITILRGDNINEIQTESDE